MANRCEHCGRNMDLVGTRHDCVPRNEKARVGYLDRESGEYIQNSADHVPPTVQCPVCEARKKSERLRKKKWREKQKRLVTTG